MNKFFLCNKQKGLAPILIVLLIALAVGGYLIYQKQIKPISVSNSIIQSSPKPAASVNKCIKASENQIFLDKNNNKIILQDLINGYQLDVTILPQIQFGADELSCANQSYEVDMYELKAKDYKETKFTGSIARFSVDVPVKNDSRLSLEDYAKQQLKYQAGKHVGLQGENYGNPFTSSPLVNSEISGDIKEISWIDNYTDSNTPMEGTTATKHYLLEVNNEIIHFQVFSWDLSSFGRATKDFDQIISTFKFLEKIGDPEGKFCGGIAANLPENQCPKGYTCQMDGNYPDAGGKCVKK